MNRISAILIILHCWHQSLSPEYITVEQHYKSVMQNQSTPRLSYQQIIRNLLPYHHQPPYCVNIPTPYYHNASVQQDHSPPRRYLLFYYDSLYHQDLLPNNDLAAQYLRKCQQKPPSGYLLFYYNTFYHQHSHISQDLYKLYDLVETLDNGIQQNIVPQWNMTSLSQHQYDWSYAKIVALTSNYMADNQIRYTQNPILNSHNTFESCIHPDIRRKKNLAFNLLNRLVKIHRNCTKQERNQIYGANNDDWFSTIKALKHKMTEINNLSINAILNGCKGPKVKSISWNITIHRQIFYKNVGCDRKIFKGETADDWQGLYRSYKFRNTKVVNRNDNSNRFTHVSKPIKPKYMKYFRKLHCHVSKFLNKTNDIQTRFATFGLESVPNICKHSQMKTSHQEKCFAKTVNGHGSSKNPLHVQI